MGLGFEVAAPDIMQRPPQSLKTGAFTWEVMIDMMVYGLWMAALCLSAFSIVLFGFGDDSLGVGCNNSIDQGCGTVFRARATTFVCMTWFSLFLAWEMVNMRRSFFHMQPKSTKYFTQWAIDIWRNKILFCAGVETWKWCKRIYFRRMAKKLNLNHKDLSQSVFARYNTEEVKEQV